MSDKYLNQEHIRRYWENKNELQNCLANRNPFFRAIYKHANSEVQKPTDDYVFRCRKSS